MARVLHLSYKPCAMVDADPSGERVPVTVLSGFLGSGKTTLLNGLLTAPHGLKLAVLINEIGAVGIDGKVVQGGETFVELDNGCLCCALNADLDRVLRELRVRGGFDHLVIETTGLADPLPIGWILSRPGLSNRYRLDAIVVVVDVASIERALTTAPEAALQIERADILVVNKLDLVTDGGAAAITRVRELNEIAPVLPATRGRLPWELLLATKSGRDSVRASPRHDPHVPSLASWVFPLPRAVSETALEDLLAEVPSDVFRVKGLVPVMGEAPWLLVNVVAGRIDIAPTQVRDGDATGALVFIGTSLDRASLHQLCERHLSSAASVDAP